MNTRSAYTMRSCGLGIIALEILLKRIIKKCLKKLRETARDVAESSMLPAVKLKNRKVQISVCR